MNKRQLPFNKNRNTKDRKESKSRSTQEEYRVHGEWKLMDFLRENAKGYSRNNIKALLTNRRISVDGAPVTQFDYRLAEGDVVSVGETKRLEKKDRRLDIIFEDEDLIAINKPSGLLSIADDKEKSLTAYRLVSDYVHIADKKQRIYVVHRIDKDTSGVLLFAKKLYIKNLLQDNWQDYALKRGYYAVVLGKVIKKEDTIRSYLLETSTHLVYVAKGKEGQEAVTRYKVMKGNDRYTLLDIDIETGRKNQIRVQLKDIGYPVVGDEKYKTADSPLRRLGLHAYALHIKDPRKEGIIKLTARMPESFNKLFHKNSVKEE